MFRLVSLTFFGKERFGKDVHPHESPKVMTIPLIVLAFLSIVGGYVGIPEIFSGEGGNALKNWFKPIFAPAEAKLRTFGSHSHFEELLLMGISVAAALSAIYFAYVVYTRKKEIADKTASSVKGLYNTLLNKYYVDEIYESSVIKPILIISEKVLWKVTDNKLIDGIVNGSAKLIYYISIIIRKMQTGVAQFYALIMMIGISVALFWLILTL